MMAYAAPVWQENPDGSPHRDIADDDTAERRQVVDGTFVSVRSRRRIPGLGRMRSQGRRRAS